MGARGVRADPRADHAHSAKTWPGLFRSRSNSRRVLLCVALQASIQLTGVSAVQYYSPAIFAHIGVSTEKALLYQACDSIVALAGQVLCILLIGR